jgi:predicted DNA-binding transcriptional regulator AlpA
VSAELATLAADPARVEDVQPDAIPALIGEAEALRARLWARLQAVSAPVAPTPAPNANGKADRLLTAQEAAERLGVNKRWMYRKADSLPFTCRLSEGTLRFSERGLVRWQESRP